MRLWKLVWRAVALRPSFAAIVIACLSLGIAVNTTLFSVFDSLLWRPFDFRSPESLVLIKSRQQRRGTAGISISMLHELRREARGFAGIAGVVDRNLSLTDGEESERVNGAMVSAELFPMLGKAPVLGQGFAADVERGGESRVVLLSDGLWRRRYNADVGILGRSIQINGEPHTVVGVMPPKFRFPEVSDLWIPLGDFGRADSKDARYVTVFARLGVGTTRQAAGNEVQAIYARVERAAGLEVQGWRSELVDLRTELIPDDVRLVVIAMMGAVTFVLLIACANVANLMLARGAARQREIAVRSALGAGRMAIIRELLAESMVYAVVAGALSLPLASFGLRLIDRGIPSGDEIPYYITWVIDTRVVLYTIAVSIVAALLFGLLPAWQATSGSLQAVIKDGGRGTGASRAKTRTRGALVVAEVALALILLVGASLFVRSFRAIQHESVGFKPTGVLSLRMMLAGTSYDSASFRQQRVEAVLERLRALPGVEAAAASNLIPLDGGGTRSKAEVAGSAFREEEAPFLWWSGVAGDWLKTLGLTLVAGRDLTAAEVQGKVPVAVIDERLAKDLWPGSDALGRTFRVAHDSAAPWFTVVGVVQHFRQGQLGDREEDPASAYLPYAFQNARNVGVMVRTSGDPLALVSAVRREIRDVDAGVALFDVLPLETVRALGFWQYGLFGWMFAVFGAIALVLAAIGVYGVISYNVTQRTQEFGVRLALGAQREGVLGMVVRGALKLAGLGIILGLIGAFGVTRLVRSLLAVSPFDPLSFVGVTLFLLMVSIAASFFPARRATGVDPIIALRAD